MNVWVDAGSWVLLLLGSFLGLSGAVGLLRFPDFFTRLHAAGVTDTLCAACVLGGLMLQAGLSLVSLKLLLILLMLGITSPTASHALAHAALRGGLQPWRRGSPSVAQDRSR